MRCTSCNRSGHIAKDCRSLNYQSEQRNTFNKNTTETGKCSKCGNFGHTKEKCNARTFDFCQQVGHLEKDCFALQRKLANYQKNTKNGFNNKTFLATSEEQEQPEEMSEQITATINKSIAELFKNLHLKD
jgi:hypothetical protein